MSNIMEKLELTAEATYCKKVEELTASELHLALGKSVMGEIVRLSITVNAELTISQLSFLWVE